MVIFHSYVSLPEGNLLTIGILKDQGVDIQAICNSFFYAVVKCFFCKFVSHFSPKWAKSWFWTSAPKAGPYDEAETRPLCAALGASHALIVSSEWRSPRKTERGDGVIIWKCRWYEMGYFQNFLNTSYVLYFWTAFRFTIQRDTTIGPQSVRVSAAEQRLATPFCLVRVSKVAPKSDSKLILPISMAIWIGLSPMLPVRFSLLQLEVCGPD